MTSSVDKSATRLATLFQAARYGAVGLLNTGIDVGLFFLLINFAHLGPIIANVISYSAGAANSFLINRYWTFSGRAASGSTAREAAIFAAVTLFGLGVSVVTIILVQPAAGVIAAKGAATALAFAATFWLNKRVTFRA